MNVDTVLIRKGAGVFTVAPGESVGDVARHLKEKDIGALVVTNDGVRVEGILSERDIVHEMAGKGVALLDMQARDIMTRDVVTCRREDTISEVLTLMTERRIRHLPVVEDGRLCGMISIGDAVKSRLDEAVAEAEALREYITQA